MTNVVAARNAVVAELKNRIKGRIHIAAHAGSFTEDDIKTLSIQTPAILTSLVGITDTEADETFLQFVEWIITKASNQDLLYDNALKLVSAVIPIVRGIDGDFALSGGESIKAECLYSGSINKMGVTLWAVAWKWKIRGTVLSEGEEENDGVILLPDDLESFDGYDAEHQQSGAAALDIVNFS